jgi:hypothetical protein
VIVIHKKNKKPLLIIFIYGLGEGISMGFYKKEFIRNGFKIYPIKDKLGICRKCGQERLEYLKFMAWGEKKGTVFHYKALCPKCGYNCYVKRTKEVYEKVKDQPWEKSSTIKSMERKQRIF